MRGSGVADGPVRRNPSCGERHGGAAGRGTGRRAGQRPLHRSPYAGRDRAPADILGLARRRYTAVLRPLRTGGTVGWGPPLARRTPDLQRCLLLLARYLRDAGLRRYRIGAGLPHLWRAGGHMRFADARLVDGTDLRRHQPRDRPRLGLTDPLTRKVPGTPQLWRLLHPASYAALWRISSPTAAELPCVELARRHGSPIRSAG